MEQQINQSISPVQQQTGNNKILYIIIGVLVFVIFCLGGYFFLPSQKKPAVKQILHPTQSVQITSAAQNIQPSIQPDEFAGWKTYRDEKNGFKFKYPVEYSLTMNSFSSPVINHKITWDIVSKIECGEEQGDCPFISNKKETLKINNYTVLKRAGSIAGVGGGIEQSYISYYLKYSDKDQYFKITLNEIPQDDNSDEFVKKYPPTRKYEIIPQNEEQMLEKILLTFKFIDQNQSDEAVNWKIYSNKENGFEFKYPKDWKINMDSQSFKEGKDLLNIYIWGPTQEEGTEFYDGAYFAIGTPISTNKDIDSWMKEYYGETSEVTGEKYTFSQKIINGRSFSTMYGCGLGCFTYYHLKNNNKIYRFSTSSAGNDKEKYDNKLNEILSSLKFINLDN